METCPVCGNETLVRESHCSTCIACGYSKCEDKDVDTQESILDILLSVEEEED